MMPDGRMWCQAAGEFARRAASPGPRAKARCRRRECGLPDCRPGLKVVAVPNRGGDNPRSPDPSALARKPAAAVFRRPLTRPVPGGPPMHTRHAFHPAPVELAAYAAGSLAEADALLVGRHLASCPDCSYAVQRHVASPAGGARIPAPSSSVSSPTNPLDESHALTPSVSQGSLPAGLADHPKFRVVRLLGQ